MGLLTFTVNVTLDGCVAHREAIADDETHAFFTGLMDEAGALDLIDEYRFLVHPRIAGHGPTLSQGGLPSARRLELVATTPLRSGAIAMHYRRAR